MGRFCRWAFNILMLISVVGCAIVAGLWIRSYVGHGSEWYAVAGNFFFHLKASTGTIRFDYEPITFNGFRLRDASVYSGPFNVDLVTVLRGGPYFYLTFPIWLPTFAVIALSTLSSLIWLRHAVAPCPMDSAQDAAMTFAPRPTAARNAGQFR
jgi:hypothetical protein